MDSDSEGHFESTRAIVVAHAIATDHRSSGADLSGVSLLWSPFMLSANAGVSIARARGSSIPADGHSWPYLWACAAGTAVYAFLALWMSYRLALRFSGPSAALAATLTIWLATSIPMFLYAQPFTEHLASAFAATVVLFVWMSVRDGADARSRWFIWGLAGGVAIITSLFNAAVLVVVVIEWARGLFRRGAARASADALVFVVAAAIIVVPALVIRHEIDGAWLWNGHFPVFHWARPNIYAAAFSLERGAFVWTPVLIAAAAGLLLSFRRQRFAGSMLILVSLAFFYVAASFNSSTEHAAFMSPWMISLTPCWVCGLAVLVDAVAGSRGRLAWAGVSIAAVALTVWNVGLMLQWGTGLLPGRGPADFRQAAAQQRTVVPHAKDFVIRYLSERRGLVSDLKRGRRE